MRPKQFARSRVQRHYGSTRSGCGINYPVYHERCGLQVVLRCLPEIVGLETPRDFELIEIVCSDLVQRRVVRVPEIAAVGSPLAVLRPGLSDNGCGSPETEGRKKGCRCQPP